MIHEKNVGPESQERIGAGQRTAIIVDHDADYQVGDELRLFQVNDWGHRTYHYEERDSKGRFSNERVEDPPVRVEITHVLPAERALGLESGKVLLSFALLDD